jgi:hypothetical protein
MVKREFREKHFGKEMTMLSFSQSSHPSLTPLTRPTIDKILAQLPGKDNRQTLLFSATFPKDVQQLASYAFRKSYKTVDTVGAETGTNVQVRLSEIKKLPLII